MQSKKNGYLKQISAIHLKYGSLNTNYVYTTRGKSDLEARIHYCATGNYF